MEFVDTQTHHFNIWGELPKTDMLKIEEKKSTLLNSTILNHFIQHLFMSMRCNNLYQIITTSNYN